MNVEHPASKLYQPLGKGRRRLKSARGSVRSKRFSRRTVIIFAGMSSLAAGMVLALVSTPTPQVKPASDGVETVASLPRPSNGPATSSGEDHAGAAGQTAGPIDAFSGFPTNTGEDVPGVLSGAADDTRLIQRIDLGEPSALPVDVQVVDSTTEDASPAAVRPPLSIQQLSRHLPKSPPLSGASYRQDKPSVEDPSGDSGLWASSGYGPLPAIGRNGLTPREAFASRAVFPETPSGLTRPKIALIVKELGNDPALSDRAVKVLPAPVTFAFLPEDNSSPHYADLARRDGHELLLQVPMEPYEQLDPDSYSRSLLATGTPAQNLHRLHKYLGRLTGYVGVMNHRGKRFLANAAAMLPVARDLSARGLIFVDEGLSARSQSKRLGETTNLPVVVGQLEVDRLNNGPAINSALSRLVSLARTRGSALGTITANPKNIAIIAAWIESLPAKGVVLVPVTHLANQPNKMAQSTGQ